MNNDHSGVVLVRDNCVIVLDTGIPWPATLANVAEHCARTITNDWPHGEERWWPTQKAMEQAR